MPLTVEDGLESERVATVVNLRVSGENTPLTPAAEGALVEKLGLSYHHLPVSLDKLNPAQGEELREILQKSLGRVFVHSDSPGRPPPKSRLHTIV